MNAFKQSYARSVRQRGTLGTWWLMFSALWRVPAFYVGGVLVFIGNGLRGDGWGES